MREPEAQLTEWLPSRIAWWPQARLLPAVSGLLPVGLVTQRPSWEKARGDAGVWRRALPGILSGHQPPGLLATSFPSLLAFQVLVMDQALALVTARRVRRPRAEEGLLTAEAGWAGFLGSGIAALSWSKCRSSTAKSFCIGRW